MYPSNQGLSDGKNNSNSSAAPSTGVHISHHPLHHHQQQEGEWSIGLCGFCSNCKTCCLTWWCPCITFGRIAEIVDQGTTSCAATGAIYCLLAYFTGCGCLYSCLYRSKLRQQFKLRESPCNDCLVHCCCEYCALCQEYNELKHRGFDMSLGWHGNMQNGGVAMAAPTAPVLQEVMTR